MTNQNRNMKVIARAAALGAEVITFLVLGYFAGKFISGLTGRKLWVFWGATAGLVGSIVSIVLFIKKYLEDLNE